MANQKGNHHRLIKWLRWIARIWSFPIIVYALMMFIGYTWSWVTTGVADPYAVEEVPFIEALPPILLFASVIGLGIAWRWERFGSILSLSFAFVTQILLIIQRPITEDISRALIPHILCLVIAIPGVLFLVCYFTDRDGG
jgi:hypothetical protein